MAFLCTFKLRLYLHYFYQKLNAVVCFLGRKCCCKQCSSKLLLSISEAAFGIGQREEEVEVLSGEVCFF